MLLGWEEGNIREEESKIAFDSNACIGSPARLRDPCFFKRVVLDMTDSTSICEGIYHLQKRWLLLFLRAFGLG